LFIRTGFPTARHLLALSLAVLVAFQMLQLPASAQNVGSVSQSLGQVAITRQDGSVVQPAPAGTAIQIGDLVSTIGREPMTFTLEDGITIELGGMTTVQVVAGPDGGLGLKLIEGALVFRTSGPIRSAFSIIVQGRLFTIPSGVGRSGWSIGLSRSPDSKVILVCDRCPGEAGFDDESETLDTGRMRTYDDRGDSFESVFRGSVFNALAEFPDDGSSSDKRPIGQRTASLPRREKDDSSVTTSTPTATSTPLPGGNSSAGGNQLAGASSTPTTTATPTSTHTPTPTVTTTPVTVDATIANFIYLPDPVEVPVGSSIRWTNLDSDIHTVTAKDLSWTSPVMTQSNTFTRKFDQVGTIDYFCEPHPQMTSRIIVTP
jgi:plastocyanin